jgi:hypothetical protein
MCIMRLGSIGPVTTSRRGTATKNWKHHAIGASSCREFFKLLGSFQGVALLAMLASGRGPLGRWLHYPLFFKSLQGRRGRFVDLRLFPFGCNVYLDITSAIMITSVLTVAAFAALTTADEVDWSGYVFIGNACDPRNLLTIDSMHHRKIFDVPA